MRAPLRSALAVSTLLAAVALAPAAPAAPPRVEGRPFAHVAITVAIDSTGTIHVPGPFAVLPGNRRVAVRVPESDGILLLEGDRIVHHFPLADSFDVDDLAASDSMLVAGRRPPEGAITVDLFLFDLLTGRMIQRIQSANPFLRAPATGRDLYRVVVEGSRVGVFDPTASASYPLWDRASGVVIGGDQMVQATSGLGFGASAVWIPNPDGSVDLKLPGHSKRLVDPGEGEFVGGAGRETIVLLSPSGAAEKERELPGELVVHVLEADRAIAELRLVAVSPAVDVERRVVTGRPVQVRDGRLYWLYLGPDFLEVRSTELPAGAEK
ncbi:MAG: hypothetical protein U0167_05800 [bacterium]